MDIAGRTMLARVVRRTQRTRLIDEVVIATTELPADDAIVTECARLGSPVFRGDERDVVDRYYRTAVAHRAELVVRITADCPLIDASEAERVIEPSTTRVRIMRATPFCQRCRAASIPKCSRWALWNPPGAKRTRLTSEHTSLLSYTSIPSGSGCCLFPSRRILANIDGRSTPHKISNSYERCMPA